jgi:DNA-directed RNA polymerase subunit alpha
MQGILEDMIMVTLNLKKLRFKIFEGESQKIVLNVKGEKEVTGADFECPSQIKLSNPDLHIATVTDKKTELEIEITIEKGVRALSRFFTHGLGENGRRYYGDFTKFLFLNDNNNV